MSDPTPGAPRLPPRWFVRTAWVVHRAIHRLTGGHRGLWTPKPGGWGAMRLTTVGRRTGRERTAILGYVEDGLVNGVTEEEVHIVLHRAVEDEAGRIDPLAVMGDLQRGGVDGGRAQHRACVSGDDGPAEPGA